MFALHTFGFINTFDFFLFLIVRGDHRLRLECRVDRLLLVGPRGGLLVRLPAAARVLAADHGVAGICAAHGGRSHSSAGLLARGAHPVVGHHGEGGGRGRVVVHPPPVQGRVCG